MLPTPSPDVVVLTIAQHIFTFRRLTWRDEMRFQELLIKSPQLTLLAYALLSVDGRGATDLGGAQKMIMGIPRPVRERVVVLYRGSLPPNRMLDALLPAPVPEPRVIQAQVDEEADTEDDAADDFLDRRFGHDEAAAAQAQAQAIASASGMQGATTPMPDRTPARLPDDEEPGEDSDEEFLDEDPPSGRYAAVM